MSGSSRSVRSLSPWSRLPIAKPKSAVVGASPSLLLAGPGDVQSRAPRRELAAGALITAIIAAIIKTVGPSPGDAPAHLYRTLLVHEGAYIWDNFWYAGSYSLAPYSLWYYFPAAVIGNLPLVFAAAVVSTVLFASIALREWGAAAIWPTRVFGVVAAAPLFTGLYSYSLGFTAMLAAVKALQVRRAATAIVFAALTVGFSPLAFGFLCLITTATFASQMRVSRRTIATAAGLLCAASLEMAALLFFPSGQGKYPFHWVDFLGVLTVSVLGALVARHARGARILGAFYLLWGLGSVVVFVVPTPIGDNWARLYAFALPLMLLTASLAGFRPRRLVAVAITAAFIYNLTPYLLLVPYRLDNRSAALQFWKPAIQFLHEHLEPGFRVEVVPTSGHWESYWIPRASIPLARGWYKQEDELDNPLLYSEHLNPSSYRGWLHSAAVAYVLLLAAPLDPSTNGPEEAAVLTSAASGLKPVFRTPDVTIYRLPHPTGLVTGPGRVRVTAFTQDMIGVVASKPGRYLVRSHFNPYLKIHGQGCIEEAPGNMTFVELRKPGSFSLVDASSPEALVSEVTAEQAPLC